MKIVKYLQLFSLNDLVIQPKKIKPISFLKTKILIKLYY